MFKELMPLLAQRTILLTVSRIDIETICVNVIPQRVKKDAEDNALTTPLSLTGTPEELDQELPRQLVEFVGAHLQLSSSLRSAKEEMEAAGKGAKEAARKATSAKPGTSSTAAKPCTAAAIATPTDSAAKEGCTESSGPPGTQRVSVPVNGNLFAESNV